MQRKKHYFYSMEEYFTNKFFKKWKYYLHLCLDEKHRLGFLYCWESVL